MLNHENIIKFLGNRREDDIEYIFLEYASGGELFDRIGNEQNYFKYWVNQFVFCEVSKINMFMWAEKLCQTTLQFIFNRFIHKIIIDPVLKYLKFMSNHFTVY